MNQTTGNQITGQKEPQAKLEERGITTMSNMRLTMRLNYVLITFSLLGLVACGGSTSPVGGLAAPTQVEAVRTSEGMLVTWKDNSSDETGFRIYRYQGLEPLSVAEAEMNLEVEANETSYTDTELDLNNDYTYRVQAFNDIDVSSAVGVGEEPEDAPPPEGQARIIVERDGGGKGQVTSDPEGIACDHVSGDNCSATFDFGTTVTLQPQPSGDSIFEGWNGQCTGTEACTISVSPDLTDANGNIRVTANIRQLSATLSVSKTGSGGGRIIDTNSGGDIIDCGETCSVSYSTVSPVIVVLRATPAEGLSFGGWRGAPCEGQTGDCRVTMDRDINLEALFGQPAPTIASFGASPQQIKAGEEATLSWTLGGTASGVKLSAVANNVTTELSVPQGASSIKVKPDVSTTYTLTAVGEGGESAPQTATVTVGGAPSITRFEADDDTVLTRTEVALSWDISGNGITGITLLADGKNAKDLPVGSSSATVKPNKTTEYTLIVESTFGRTERKLTVRVGKRPDIDEFEPVTSPIIEGERAELVWEVSENATVSLDNGIGPVNGERALSDVLSETTTFELTATNDFGVRRATTTVEVEAAELLEPKILSFGVRGDVEQVSQGQEIILEWEIENQAALSDLVIEFNEGSNQIPNPRRATFLQTNVVETTDYTLSAIAPGGRDVSKTITVEVVEPAAIGTFEATDAVRAGEFIRLNWTGVTGKSAELLWDGVSIPVTGLDFPEGRRVFIAPLEPGQITFTLIARDALDNPVQVNQVVNVLPREANTELPVIASFEADESEIEQGERVVLSWDIPNQDTLTRLVMLRDVGDTLSSQNPTEDTILRARPNETTTYTLEVENEDGVTRSRPITITVEDSDPNVVPDDAGFETF